MTGAKIHPSLVSDCPRCRFLGADRGNRVEYNTWNCDVCGTVWYPPPMVLALKREQHEPGYQTTLDEALGDGGVV
jgi:ribosomal protein L37AE/L43A